MCYNKDLQKGFGFNQRASKIILEVRVEDTIIIEDNTDLTVWLIGRPSEIILEVLL